MRIDDLSKQVSDLKVSLEVNQKVFDDFKISFNACSKNCSKIRSDLDTNCKSLISVSDKTVYLDG